MVINSQKHGCKLSLN
jgi:ABC-type protease/lipase transport system fused ATPase/permease subunit